MVGTALSALSCATLWASWSRRTLGRTGYVERNEDASLPLDEPRIVTSRTVSEWREAGSVLISLSSAISGNRRVGVLAHC